MFKPLSQVKFGWSLFQISEACLRMYARICFFYKMPAFLKPQRPIWEQAIQTLMLTTFILKQSFHTGYLPGNEFIIFRRHSLKPTSTVTSVTKYVLKIYF